VEKMIGASSKNVTTSDDPSLTGLAPELDTLEPYAYEVPDNNKGTRKGKRIDRHTIVLFVIALRLGFNISTYWQV
jgi:hypothetical protein